MSKFNDGEITTRELLFSVKKNQIKMLERRGYEIGEIEKEMSNYNLEQFINKVEEIAAEMSKTSTSNVKISFTSALSNAYIKYNLDGSRDINYIHYVEPQKDKKKISVGQILSIIELAEGIRAQYIDIITETDLHPQARQRPNEITHRTFQIWLYKQLAFDIYESPYVFKYRKLTKDEIKAIFYDDSGKPKIKRSTLPMVRKDDILAGKYLALKTGDIITYEFVNFFTPSMVPNSIEFLQVTNESIYEIEKTSKVSN